MRVCDRDGKNIAGSIQVHCINRPGEIDLCKECMEEFHAWIDSKPKPKRKKKGE
jgi:hypothetical protein